MYSTIIKDEYKAEVEAEGVIELWKESGLFCAALRHVSGQGQLNGYVGVCKGSTLYGMDYDYYSWGEEPKEPLTAIQEGINGISVHGGMTYSGKWSWFNIEDVWWFGFDTVHANDIPPYKSPFPSMSMLDSGSYRNMEYVKREVSCLAKQLSDLEKSLNNG